MAVKGVLKVSRSAYEQQLHILEGKLQQLNSTVSDYQTLKSNMTSFIDGKDDNYESLRESVEHNISVVKKSASMTQNAIDMLKDTLAEFDEFGENASKAVDQAKEIAKEKVKNTLAAIFD